MRIGYQGLIGSNSEIAAKKMAEDMGLHDVEFVPLVSSKRVINKLKLKSIDYAVVAVKNTLGGTVVETFEAIKDEYLELVSTTVLAIHHSLYKRKDVDIETIDTIASHIQALKQTEINRSEKYPHCQQLEVEDTAIAAKYLDEGKLGANVAVLCRKEAGEYYNLELVEENLEDNKNNYTEFRMFKLSDIDYTNSEKPSIKEQLIHNITADNSKSVIIESIITLLIAVVCCVLSLFFTKSTLNIFSIMGLYIVFQIIYIIFHNSRNRLNNRALVGYWKYYSLSEDRDNHRDQQIDTPRIVKIEEIDGELVFHGFICDKENLPFFESQKVLTSKYGKCKGSLVYWYGTPEEIHRKYNLGGIVELNWRTKYSAGQINKMSGNYTGYITKDRGSLQYLRITEKEYLAHKNNEFI